jgi:hypothetical protein
MTYKTTLQCDQCGYAITGETIEVRRYGRRPVGTAPTQTGVEHYHPSGCFHNIMEQLDVDRDQSMVSLSWFVQPPELNIAGPPKPPAP